MAATVEQNISVEPDAPGAIRAIHRDDVRIVEPDGQWQNISSMGRGPWSAPDLMDAWFSLLQKHMGVRSHAQCS